jgi:SAM-dependent methyltransferase
VAKERDAAREEYLLGSEDEELQRLGFQHRVWAEQAHALWRRARFGYGETILDLGCGPGFTTIDLAHLVGPQGRVVALDGSRRFLAYLEREAEAQGLERIELVHGDAARLDLPAECLDGAYARWLFCFVEDPQAVVDRVAGALRSGARFAITDYFNYGAFTFAPRSAALDRVVEAVQACWHSRGGDLDVQSHMPAMLRRAGLEVETIEASARVARPGTALWNWPRTFFINFMPTLLQGGFVTEEEGRAFEQAWAERGADPSAFLYLPPMADIIAVKP